LFFTEINDGVGHWWFLWGTNVMLRGHGDCFYLNRMFPLLVVGMVEEPSLLLPSQQM
jgi:hypothetical protein